MGFGTSYSIENIDCLDWVHTRLSKRLVRGFFGVALPVVIFFLLNMIHSTDSSTTFVLQHAMPALLFSLFTYGWYPLLCLKMNLVDTTDASIIQDPEERKQYDPVSDTNN